MRLVKTQESMAKSKLLYYLKLYSRSNLLMGRKKRVMKSRSIQKNPKKSVRKPSKSYSALHCKISLNCHVLQRKSRE